MKSILYVALMVLLTVCETNGSKSDHKDDGEDPSKKEEPKKYVQGVFCCNEKCGRGNYCKWFKTDESIDILTPDKDAHPDKEADDYASFTEAVQEYLEDGFKPQDRSARKDPYTYYNCTCEEPPPKFGPKEVAALILKMEEKKNAKNIPRDTANNHAYKAANQKRETEEDYLEEQDEEEEVGDDIHDEKLKAFDAKKESKTDSGGTNVNKLDESAKEIEEIMKRLMQKMEL